MFFRMQQTTRCIACHFLNLLRFEFGKINCGHLVCMVYRPPNDGDSICTSISANMDQLVTINSNSIFLTCDDFNCHHASRLGVSSATTSHDNSA